MATSGCARSQDGGVPRPGACEGVGVEVASARLAEGAQLVEVGTGMDPGELLVGCRPGRHAHDGVLQLGSHDPLQRRLDALRDVQDGPGSGSADRARARPRRPASSPTLRVRNRGLFRFPALAYLLAGDLLLLLGGALLLDASTRFLGFTGGSRFIGHGRSVRLRPGCLLVNGHGRPRPAGAGPKSLALMNAKAITAPDEDARRRR